MCYDILNTAKALFARHTREKSKGELPLNISLDTILSELNMQNAHIVSSNSFSIRQPQLSAAALWSKDEPVSRDLCYVLPAKDVRDEFSIPPKTTVVIVGAADEAVLRASGVDALVIDVPVKRTTFNIWFNRINRIFQEYQQWSQSMSELLARSPSLQDLSALGESFFGNPVLILDRNFCLLSKYDPSLKIAWSFHKQTQERMLPEEMIAIIKAQSGHESHAEGSHTFFISDDYLTYNMQFLHMSRGNAIFTLAVPEVRAPLRKLSLSALSYFAECVLVVLCQTSFHYGHSQRFEEFVKKLLSNEQIEQAVINQQLLTMRWLNADNCICLVFEINRWDRANSVYHSTCMNIESTFSESFAFVYNDRIVTLINLDKAQVTRDAMIQKIILFLREHLLHVGISYTFFDFSTVISYYKEAEAALEMGRLYAPDLWYYRFEDYVLPYFMHYGTTQINGRHLCHPGLVQLWLYDNRNETELLTTLREYLTTGLNATATAKHLYIHRNTLYQRLDKINQIIGADLNDPDTRLFMLMSYSFVDLLKLKPIEEVMPDAKKDRQ